MFTNFFITLMFKSQKNYSLSKKHSRHSLVINSHLYLYDIYDGNCVLLNLSFVGEISHWLTNQVQTLRVAVQTSKPFNLLGLLANAPTRPFLMAYLCRAMTLQEAIPFLFWIMKLIPLFENFFDKRINLCISVKCDSCIHSCFFSFWFFLTWV